MKILVETAGSFQILYAEQNELVRHYGITVVQKSQTMTEHMAMGQVLLRGQVNDEATDEEWLETLAGSDGDEELALASFLERFPVDAESARKAEPAKVAPSTTQMDHNKGQKGRRAAPNDTFKE